MLTCQVCGSQNSDDAKFCKNCGAPIALDSIQKPGETLQGGEGYPPTVPFAPQPVQTYAQRPPKDRSIALILEILPGLFGFLGIGWIYSGNTTAGVIWLIGFLIWTAMATLISVLTGGIGIICWLPISIALITVSAVTLNNYTKKHPDLFGV